MWRDVDAGNEVAGAIAEGCELVQLMAPSRIDTDKHGQVKALWVKPQIAGQADKSGRPRPIPANMPEEKIPCQIIISAIGQATDTDFFENYGVPVFHGNIEAENTLDEPNKISTKESNMTISGNCLDTTIAPETFAVYIVK